MIEVNLFGGFTHLHKEHGIYSMTDNRVPKNWKWIRNKQHHNGITIFTDDYMCNESLVKSVQSKYKIGMIIEPPQINSTVYTKLPNIIDNFNFIITYNKDLINQYPEKIKYYPYGGCWVLDQHVGVYEKTKNISIIYSNKKQTDGHRLRHVIADKFNSIDKYGSGANVSFNYKEEILAPYRFTIVVENCQIDDYFSEKLLDSLAVGTIPIYWGTKNIGKYFDDRGIIQFNSIEELEDILPTLTKDLYDSKIQYIRNNIDNVKKYWCQEDWIQENIFSMLENEIVDYQPNDPRTKVDGYTQNYWLSKFFQDGGDEILYNLNLNKSSVVFDMGSYNGEYYQIIYNKFKCNIHTFEPIKQFSENLPIVPNLTINSFALGSNNETFELTLDENSSSAFTIGEKVSCMKKKFTEYVKEKNIEHIDLIKINIEGGEYELLNEIINSNWISKIDNYLIQFHYLSYAPIKQRQQIIDQLKQTHEPVFYYPFVWEHWKRKDVV